MGLASLGVRGAGYPVLTGIATTPPDTDVRRNGPTDAAQRPQTRATDTRPASVEVHTRRTLLAESALVRHI